jgi:uncharacterized integral membrane protein
MSSIPEAEGAEPVEPDGEQPPDTAAGPTETKQQRRRRHARRTRLQINAGLSVLIVAYVIALAALNTGRVREHWVFGTSHVGLVWIVLFAVILGWLLGVFSIAAFHWRTRRPRDPSKRRFGRPPDVSE